MKKNLYSMAKIAEIEGVTVEIVRRWAVKNNISKLSSARTAPYIFNEDEFLAFKNRKDNRFGKKHK